MTAREAEALIATIQRFVDAPAGKASAAAPAATAKAPAKGNGQAATAGTTTGGEALRSFPDADEEKLYQKFKNRLIDEAHIDPILLNLIMVRPEIIVDVERRIERLDGDSLRGRIARLAAAGFFSSARSSADVKRELMRTGTEPAGNRLSEAFTALVNGGFLTREGDGYQIAPGVKVTTNTIEA